MKYWTEAGDFFCDPDILCGGLGQGGLLVLIGKVKERKKKMSTYDFYLIFGCWLQGSALDP